MSAWRDWFIAFAGALYPRPRPETHDGTANRLGPTYLRPMARHGGDGAGSSGRRSCVRPALTPWLNQLAGAVLCQRARFRHVADSGRQRDSRIRIRFHRSPAAAHQPGRHAYAGAEPQTVADFHRRVLDLLRDIGIAVTINELPNEVPEPIRFSEDRVHRAYDPAAAHRFPARPVQSDRILNFFRSGFGQGQSGAHLFWGGFDLAVTRFGRCCSIRRHSAARPHHTRGIFARGEQRGVLAGKRCVPAGGVLLLCLSGTGWLPRLPDNRRRRLQPRAGRIHPALRCVARRRGPGRPAARLPVSTYAAAAGDGRLGPRGAGMPFRRTGAAARRPEGTHRCQPHPNRDSVAGLPDLRAPAGRTP